ncbi:MAG: hypothetical protein V4664_01905 [Patescibacteria group bacterium]
MNTIDHAYLQKNRQIIELSATVDHSRNWREIVQKFPDKMPTSCPLQLSNIEHSYAQREEGVEQVQFVLVRGSQDYKDPERYAEMSGLKTTNVRELVSCAEQHADLPEQLGSDQHCFGADGLITMVQLFSTERIKPYGLVTWLRFDLDRVYSIVNSSSNKSPGNWHLFRK